MKHLQPDELIDAMDGTLTADRQAHLASCELCRQELNGVSSMLSEARQVSVPEPSPLFWDHFSTRVRGAVDADTSRSGAWPGWLRWQVLGPVGAMAMLVLALVMSVPKVESPQAPAADALAAIESDATVADGWGIVADLVGDFDVEAATAAGVIEPGIAELAVLSLTAEEQQELTRLLQAELTRAKS